MTFEQSLTCENLMRAFAGESMARNRYTFAAQTAGEQKLFVLSRLFLFTAGQEKEHGELFYERLLPVTGSNIAIEANYPADPCDDMLTQLNYARHNEFEEYRAVYPQFASVARDEGFPDIARLFDQIAQIEKTHGERFAKYARLLEQGNLFRSECETAWLCLNCGHVHIGLEAPEICPVCQHEQGYFIRMNDLCI